MPTQTLSLQVPPGCAPGDQLQISVNGQTAVLVVPEGASPGTVLQFQVEVSPGGVGDADSSRSQQQTETGNADGNAADASDVILDEESDSGPTYTSGEEDGSGPAILTPSQWRQRHPSPSVYRSITRPFRTHYFHNQKECSLYKDETFNDILACPILEGREVESVRYSEAISTPTSFDKFCKGMGKPAILTHVPHADEVMASLSHATLSMANSPVQDTQVRICKDFQWGKKNIDGRLPLHTFFRLMSENPKADIPFYVFENDIGGKRHTYANYKDVDAWSYGQVEEDSSLSGGREFFSDCYKIPTLFSKCCLQVPYLLRPRSTDGVLLIGCRRSGSFPHVDPTYTSAWNWMLDGVKRWCLFPPHIPRDVICGSSSSGTPDGDLESKLLGNGVGYWWLREYPRLRGRAEELGMVEVLQTPGSIIWVPQGWWHAVINVSDWTVAVTHNVVLPQALPEAFRMAVDDDPVFARRWWRCLCKFAPEAALSLQDDEEVKAAIDKCLGISLPIGEYNGMTNNATVRCIDTELFDEIERRTE